ncbi:MAG: DEAD/DEAH box helicase [Fusobacteriaceae bacterium]|jgi:ATP-dependent DNA helicase DinG|nr:DEAD/DEAH box helicase [Fusobacteriaceae bacterium]
MKAEERIHPEACELMKNAIAEAGGNEVFFRGIPDDRGIVMKAQVLARGNRGSVPAILKIMRKGEVILHNHPSGYLYPSDADTEIASVYANAMAGAAYIINNDVTELYVITELLTDKNVPIDIGHFFAEDGILLRTFPDFEYRKEQLEMALHIEEGLNSETKIIVEAGTGTGKTLAYLIPVIKWAKLNKKRAVISTNTINLQEQLLNKDIPIVKKIIGEDFKYLLVKGRGNYLCNRKYSKAAVGENIDVSDFSHEQSVQIKEILKWGASTLTGDRSELAFEVDGTIWEHFSSETDVCAGNKCRFRDECFFMRSRNEKRQADILITNHHMFFSDLAIRKETGFQTDFAIIPDYGLAVFDEAHNVEKVARDYFSLEISKYGFTKVMNYIYAFEGKRKKQGMLENLYHYLRTSATEDKDELLKDLDDVRKAHRTLLTAGREYFNYIIDSFSKGQEGTFTFRIKKEEIGMNRFLERMAFYREEFSKEYLAYSKKVMRLVTPLEDDPDPEGTVLDFVKYLKRLDAFFNTLKFVNAFEDENYIYWIEVNSKKSNAKLLATPLKIDQELKQHLYLHLRQIIFTSATIAIGRSFAYFKGSLGLSDEQTIDKAIASPFDYDRQMKVYVPHDVHEPNSAAFAGEISEYLKGLLTKSMGKTFVLFTSYKLLNYVYYMIRDDLETLGLDLFIHGMAPRTKLLNMFLQSKNPVLFGTDSFWEGVDIKGSQLSSVIIVKLPFKVPNDPVTEAIIEHIESQGRNSFLNYQVPEAVIKFKQGIGRLIRSKSDRGIITILDNRVIHKRYGHYFLESIPTRNTLVASKLDILNDIGVLF